MNSFLGYLIIGSVLGFVAVSLGFFIKRYMENKEKINNISREGSHDLKRSLEDELKQKKEEEQKKLEAGDRNTITEVLERLFKSSKLAGWVKSKTYQLYNTKNLSLIVNMSGKDELINSKKEIVLKTGEIYTQNKHYMAIKKEYSEKVFMCALKVLDECFTTLPTIYKIHLSIYITDEETETQLCVLSLESNKDQYKAIRDKRLGFIEVVDFYKANYMYDSKTHDFQEIEPVSTPAGEASLEKTMASKVSANTTFYGNTILTPNTEPVNNINPVSEASATSNSKIGMETKISSLSGSIMLDKEQLGIQELIEKMSDEKESTQPKSDFEVSVEKFLSKNDFKIIKEDKSINNDRNISAVKMSEQKTYLIGVSESTDTVKEETLKTFFFKMVKDNIEKSIYISNGAFGLDSVTYASVNGIEIFDKEKLHKSIV